MMEKEKTLEDIFRNFDPELNDNEVFMRKLNRKLEAVEYLKAVQDRQLRRYKYAVIAAFVTGIISGGGLFAFILKHPDAIPSIAFKTSIPVLDLLVENSYMLFLSIIALLMSYAIISIVNLMQEVRGERI